MPAPRSMVWRAVCIAKLTQHHERVMAILLHDRAAENSSGGQRPMFMIGERIRNVRQQQGLSQKHIEERTGLLRCYVSRVENGHTVPSLETLERFAWALGVPLHLLFREQGDLPPAPNPGSREALLELAAKDTDADSEVQFLLRLKDLLSRMVEPDREVVLAFARKLATPR